jgi:hypothetical protein
MNSPKAERAAAYGRGCDGRKRIGFELDAAANGYDR